METSTLAHGKTIFSTDKEYTSSLMEKSMMDSLIMASWRERESTSMIMELHTMMEPGRTT